MELECDCPIVEPVRQSVSLLTELSIIHQYICLFILNSSSELEMD
jgi:hypothetical protein